MKSVLLIIPAYNEAANIVPVVNNIVTEYPEYDYVIVNDGSSDETSSICKNNHFEMLDLPINLGIGGAVQMGYRYAWNKGYDIAVQIDGDGQHDVSYLKRVIEPIEKKEADVVVGSRFIEKEGFQSSKVRRVGIYFISTLIKICTGVRVYDVTSGFRAVNRKYIDIYRNDYPNDYPEPEAIVVAALNAARIQEIPVVMRERENGKSSINLGKSIYYMIKVSLAIIICRISLGFRRK